MKKKYLVEITEKLTYKLEVEAEDEKQAEELAYTHPNFVNNLCSENDSDITRLEEIKEEE